MRLKYHGGIRDGLIWNGEGYGRYAAIGRMKARDVIKRLEADGWCRIRSKGGHRQFKHPFKKGRVTVAGQTNIDVPIKTLRSIWKQAQLPEEP